MAKIEKSTFPTSEILVLITILEQGDKYGYQIIEELQKTSDSTFLHKEGFIYPILHELEIAGEVCSYISENKDAKMRRYYRLTKQGIHTLAYYRQHYSNTKIGQVLGGEAFAQHKNRDIS